MSILNFYHFFTYFGPFFSHFWFLDIFGVKFLQIVIWTYINYVKIALINGISMGFINFYHFLPILDPFLAFGYILGQFPIYCHMCMYKLCNQAKNCTHKWYFSGHFYFFTIFLPILDTFLPFFGLLLYFGSIFYRLSYAHI